MKMILFVGAALGIAMIGSAQTAQAPEALVTSNKAVQDAQASLRHFTGAVDIQIGGIRVTADEADLHLDTGEYDLRGNVHLKTRPGR